MGIQVSTVRHILCGQSQSEWCYPVTPYTPFPKDQWPAGENGLLTDIHVLPESLQHGPDHDGWFWWSDAQFVPFKDTYLFATTSAFQPRVLRVWVAVSHISHGKVLLYNLSSPLQMQCSIFGRTSCSVFPKVNPHPLGEIVAFCGTGEVVLMSANGDPVYSRSRDISNAVHVYCSIAKNGISFACLKRGMGVFFLESYTLDMSLFYNDCIRCHNICPGFIPSKNIPDIVVCKFSPDCKFLAVSCNKGYLFIVRRNKLEKFCIVAPDMINISLSSAQAFDYHPCSPYQIVTLGTSDKYIHTVNIETKEILISTETKEHIDCLTYTHDGLFMAVGFHNFDISIFITNDLTPIHSIPMSNLCQNHLQRVQVHAPAVLHLSFTQNGEHLASTSCDGHLRLWRIPRMFSLQEICRDKILTCLPIRNVQKLLNVPEKIKNYLLYKYYF